MNATETMVAVLVGLFVLAAWMRILSRIGYSTGSAIGMTLLLAVPVVNLGVIAYIAFGKWPIESEAGSSPDERAFALYREGSRLEAKGDAQAALAKYEEAVAAHPGSAAARDAEASIRHLRRLTA